MTGDQAIKILSRLDGKGFVSQEDFAELKDYISRISEQNDYLKSEILRCRRKEVHMDGVIYAEIDGSQVFRLHNKIWQEVSKNQ